MGRGLASFTNGRAPGLNFGGDSDISEDNYIKRKEGDWVD
jgi:hypothetical protein